MKIITKYLFIFFVCKTKKINMVITMLVQEFDALSSLSLIFAKFDKGIIIAEL